MSESFFLCHGFSTYMGVERASEVERACGTVYERNVFCVAMLKLWLEMAALLLLLRRRLLLLMAGS